MHVCFSNSRIAFSTASFTDEPEKSGKTCYSELALTSIIRDKDSYLLTPPKSYGILLEDHLRFGAEMALRTGRLRRFLSRS